MSDPILQFFRTDHLADDLKIIAQPFHDLARSVASLPRNSERTVSLRYLLEAKSAAIRAHLYKDDERC